MGRKKTTTEPVQETLPQTEPETQPEGGEGEKKTRKPRAIDVDALRTLADGHEDAEAAQLLINRLDAYTEAATALAEAQATVDLLAGKVRKAAALLD